MNDPQELEDPQDMAALSESVTAQAALSVLHNGEVQVIGRFRWGSNYTFLAEVLYEGDTLPAVYKPTRGETPLWDFPIGSLAKREVGAFVTSKALGWDLVPPTVLRADGPAGGGSLQLFVDADPSDHYFTFTDEEKERLRPVATFDLLINNADRKGGHILITREGRIQLIDHGLCFHAEPKLRTVVWDFGGETIPEGLLADLETFHADLIKDQPLRRELSKCLTDAEMCALQDRAERLLREGRFPQPGPGRPYPWPLV
jgi:uncharacterized repeat protein (TIGR03843 family)